MLPFNTEGKQVAQVRRRPNRRGCCAQHAYYLIKLLQLRVTGGANPRADGRQTRVPRVARAHPTAYNARRLLAFSGYAMVVQPDASSQSTCKPLNATQAGSVRYGYVRPKTS